VIPFLAFPLNVLDVRRMIDTTNAVEAPNRQLLEAVKTSGRCASLLFTSEAASGS
jgi:hypothetical protein